MGLAQTLISPLEPRCTCTLGAPSAAEKSGCGSCGPTQAPSALDHSDCTANPLTALLGALAQMSPISPQASSYQPRRWLLTSGSVAASLNSWESMTVSRSVTVTA